MWEGKYCQSIDRAFPVIFVYMDIASEYIEQAGLTKLSLMFSELLLELYSRSSSGNRVLKAWMSTLERRVREFKDTLVRLYEDHCECGLLKMKFHLLDPNVMIWRNFLVYNF